MAIAVECQDCHRSYKVDDKLAGKKVKCRNCGALLRVPGEESTDDGQQQCLSCGKEFARGTRVCPHCGFNTYTGEKEAVPGEDAEAERERKNKRWVRRAGSPLLATLDTLTKGVLTLALLGGIAMTIVQICLSPGGISLPAVIPMLVVLALISVIMAPLSTVAVNFAVRKLKLAPREDTYSRVALCLLLPFSLAMLTGWPKTAQWDLIAGLGWPLAILLLLYLLRADVIEWAVSLAALAVAVGISLIIVSLAGSAINDMANGLWGDMLPSGPWTALATGHSPPPKVVVVKPPTSMPATVAGSTPASVPATGPDVVTTTQGPTTEVAATTTGPATAATAPVATGPVRMTSPFFAGVIEEPAFADAFAVVAPAEAGDWMLALRIAGNDIEADRWSLNPLEKKERYSSPNFPDAPPQFAISPKGDAVAMLALKPRLHLGVFVPENKNLNRSVWLDLPSNVPQGLTKATPIILAVIDPTRFYLRWDLAGESAFQSFAASATGTGSLTMRSFAIGPVVENCPGVLAPNGRMTAVLGRNMLYFAQTDGTVAPRPFPVASDTNVRLLAMTFSPDSTQVAIYAAIAGLPTVACYQVRNGDPVFTCLLSRTPLEKDPPAFPHRLLWLPGGGGTQSCLVDGNELIDTATGKKFASLGLSGLADASVVGPSTLALTFKTGEGYRTVLAKLDDAKIRAAQPK
jgi:hypothetical protein